MSRHLTNQWQNEQSIQHENTRFAFMFILFTLFAFLITIILFIFANNSYQNHAELFQRHFIPYFILALISLILFLIFFIGSLAYTSKSLLKSSSSSSSRAPVPLPRTILKTEPTPISVQTDV